jgi:PDZ domain
MRSIRTAFRHQALTIALAMLCMTLAVIGVVGESCPMQMKFYTSYDTCNAGSVIASATVYADGQCHTVETDTATSSKNYLMLPGNYRLECTSGGKLVFLQSACEQGTCSSTSQTCSYDESVPGSLFARVPGQLAQDPAVGDSYTCERLYDDQNRIFFSIFGNCSLSGCSVDGSVTPTSSKPTSVPASTPTVTVPQQSPTRRPQTPVAVPVPSTVAPVRVPTSSAPVQVPVPIATTLSPRSSKPVALPVTNAPITAAPIQTTAPIIVRSPTITPFLNVTSKPTGRPNAGVRPSSSIPAIETPTIEATNNSSNDNNVVVLGAIGGSITVVALALAFFLVRIKRRHSKSVTSKNGAIATTSSSEVSKGLHLSDALNNHDRLMPVATTNEIWFDPSKDDISTLDGGTMHDMAFDTAVDERTASVNMDYDFNRNQYRSSSTADERSRFTSSTNPTAFTTLSKLGMRSATSSVFDRNNDAMSFDQQFANMDDEEIMTAVGSMPISRIRSNTNANTTAMNEIANRIRPFEVMVPPGMLGLVIDTPNESVPVIRAIKPTSVLYPQVQVGDRLISVDQQNVTSMTALQVSQLITQKQNQNRIFVLCRLLQAPPPPAMSPP